MLLFRCVDAIPGPSRLREGRLLCAILPAWKCSISPRAVRFRNLIPAYASKPRRCSLAATVWKGFVSFGLVSFPVRLQVAAREKSIQFHLLHKKDLSRVKEVYFCQAENKPLGHRTESSC